MGRTKRYVPVLVQFSTDGKMRPTVITYAPGQNYAVDKVLDVHRRACESVGGVGDCYRILVLGKETRLWFEKGRWFIEDRHPNH